MRRQLVLTNEAARHPFRQTLPPPRIEKLRPEPMSDGRLFLLTFAAGLLAFYEFLS